MEVAEGLEAHMGIEPSVAAAVVGRAPGTLGW